MGCGCGGNRGSVNNSQQLRANQQIRKSIPIIPTIPTNNFLKQQPMQQVSAADKRRIQRLHQDAIRRSLNH